ncbi:GNAT family N-acetyltransferase [Paenibacillus solisilvae]|uniref:GNAT family N-acetyltransferase n=1 Tax=Paenibacillus solisilvae TaxID=2486751 RepID=A0ABW0VWI9_9BACL
MNLNELEIVPVRYEHKSILRNLLELYQYETSAFEADEAGDVHDDGTYGYRYLDHYWTEQGRFAYFIQVSGKLAGFVMLRQLPDPEADTVSFSIAEFFIMRKYQRLGVGQRAAVDMFTRFKGKWSVSWLKDNGSAQQFWTACIRKFSKGQCLESMVNGNPSLHFNS